MKRRFEVGGFHFQAYSSVNDKKNIAEYVIYVVSFGQPYLRDRFDFEVDLDEHDRLQSLTEDELKLELVIRVFKEFAFIWEMCLNFSRATSGFNPDLPVIPEGAAQAYWKNYGKDSN